jgi:uncharacterized membrane protein YidH (DUF202 family)
MVENVIPPVGQAVEIDTEGKKKKKEAKDDLSYEKMVLALYRAQMAMVRTATTMTTFGFALYKLISEKSKDGTERPLLKIFTPRVVALTLFFAGFLGLVTYSVKHVYTLKKINRFNKSFYYSGVMLMTYVIMLLTFLLFVGTLINE